MATTVDEVASESVAHDGVGGFGESVVYHVHDVEGGTSSEKRFNALNADGIPALGSGHPVLGARAPVIRREARPLPKANSLQVIVEYGRPTGGGTEQEPDVSPGYIQVGAATTQVKTIRDVNGDIITVSHTFVETDVLGKRSLKTETQVPEVEVDVPEVVLNRTLIQSFNALRLARAFVGRVNRSGIWGFRARQLLCTNIDSQSTDNGVTYSNTYEFQATPTNWDTEVRFVDSKTGKIPDDLVAGVGIKRVRVLPEIEFRSLPVSF